MRKTCPPTRRVAALERQRALEKVAAFHKANTSSKGSRKEELSCFTAETDSRGRIVIPSHVREQLSIEKSTEVDVLITRGDKR